MAGWTLAAALIAAGAGVWAVIAAHAALRRSRTVIDFTHPWVHNVSGDPALLDVGVHVRLLPPGAWAVREEWVSIRAGAGPAGEVRCVRSIPRDGTGPCEALIEYRVPRPAAGEKLEMRLKIRLNPAGSKKWRHEFDPADATDNRI